MSEDQQDRGECPRRQNGFALVIVLGILVLVAVLAIGFLTRATTERSSASGYQASAATRQLADMAVSLVQGQINQAATQGSTVAWTSQPGMVRTFDTTGKLLKAYKLYSAQNMVSSDSGISNGQSVDAPPSDWADSLAFWTDLNSSVIDPNSENGNQDKKKIYPILDPSLAVAKALPGYSITGDASMPVRWLYVLKEGQMVIPTKGSGNTAFSFEPVSPSKENPIVGRIAFWTDDESCKVNINTAGEGTFWDVPRAVTDQERSLARYQPAQKEYQRYPGHPATTSLSAVLPSGLTLKDYLDLTPRYKFGGSQGASAVPSGPINLQPAYRLLPSLDELIFKPDRKVVTMFKPEDLEFRRFFLTSHSRAPETNLFNFPKIATWPIYRLVGSSPYSTKSFDPDRTTAFDRLIGFCASTGGVASGGQSPPLEPYFLQRSNALSGTEDFSIPRNLELYSYLQALTSLPVPGFGGSFLGKYPLDRDQILTEIFDYIRCENLYDDNLVNGKGYQFTTNRGANNDFVTPGFGMVTPGRHPDNGTQGFGRFYTVTEMGFIFICNAQPDKPGTSADESSGSNNPATNAALNGTALSANEKRIQALFLFELFSPMQGFIPMGQNMKIEITGLDLFTVNGTNLGLPGATQWTMDSSYMSMYGGRQWGGNPDWRAGVYDSNVTKAPSRYPYVGIPITISTTANSGKMVFSGGTVTVRLLSIDGKEVQKITAKFPSAQFPAPSLVASGTNGDSNLGIPATAMQNWWKFNSTNTYSSPLDVGRLRSVGESPWPDNPGALIRTGDVVRTILVSHGDFRLVAARPELNDSEGKVFVPHPQYANTAVGFADDFFGAPRETGYVGGKYIDGFNYDSMLQPDIPSNSPVNATRTGDFDTGVAMAPDGAYINKPDEGNTRDINSLTAYPYFDNSWRQLPSGPTFFSPNRQVASPVTFGSLPTGIMSGHPWQTLLFRPTASAESTHPGANTPNDHLLLDLFWMPVVEPYAISDRFSTAGKINMNSQIVPFTNIKRQTGLYAVLKNEMVTSIPNAKIQTVNAGWYKLRLSSQNPFFPSKYRVPIDVAETLLQFDARFIDGDVFRSPSEICNLYIVPEGQKASGMAAYWNDYRLTGDNVRESLYGRIYPRLTTKSNTYTVHFRAQALKQSAKSSPETWTEGRDQVTGEYRGSTTIERFVDANNPDIPDYAGKGSNLSSLPTLDTFYRWRIIENRQFAP